MAVDKQQLTLAISEIDLLATESVDRCAAAQCREHFGICDHIILDSSTFPSQPPRRNSS